MRNILDTERDRQTGRTIGILRFYWRVVVLPHLGQASFIFALMIIGAVLEVVSIGLAVPLLDAVMESDRAGGSGVQRLAEDFLRSWGVAPNDNLIIVLLLASASLLFLVRSAFTLLHQYLTTAAAHRLRRETKSTLLQRFLWARYEDISKRGRGAILYDINEPSSAVYAGIIELGGLVAGILNGAVLLVLMFYLSWWATLLIGLIAISGVQGLRKVMDFRSMRYGHAIYELQADQSKVEVDSIDGMKVVKGYGLQDRMLEKHRSLLAAEIQPTLQLALFQHAPPFLNEAVACFIVLGLGCITFLRPDLGLKFSTLVALLVAIRRASPAIAMINSNLVDLNRRRRGIEILEEVLYQTPQERLGRLTAPKVGEIKIENVSFRYDARPDQLALQDVNLTLKRGTVTALVGPTGAGKSTVASLLLGFYYPCLGKIRINATDLGELDLQSWRAKLGYVSQDTFLFNATLRDNIALWNPETPIEDVEWAAEVAQLHSFVKSLPDGYDTVVGDRGLRLSGGQCQRVAIARAVLRHPEVLIFDEATSALDNLTEQAVYEAITALRSGAIVLVIAHRLSTVREADQIAVIQTGKVVEVGTHESLIRRDSVYSKLYNVDLIEGINAPTT